MKVALPANTTISHYRILSRPGSGGMGEVYLAKDTRLGRKVAIKLLPNDLTKNEDRLHRFEQEARAASALNHPNIITIHEIGEAEGIHFIATEFIEGQTLRRQMAGGRLKLGATLEVATQVASALSAAHAAGIVHRDIKPENVMLRRDGYVKVLDFGLAKLTERRARATDTDAPTSASVKTDPGTVMGTVTYISPEQARGMEVDARTDIFSLGVVLYEMISGRLPFEGETTTDVLVSILEKEPPPLSRHAPEAPAELQRIVSKALRKDREERYIGAYGEWAAQSMQDPARLSFRQPMFGNEEEWRAVARAIPRNNDGTGRHGGHADCRRHAAGRRGLARRDTLARRETRRVTVSHPASASLRRTPRLLAPCVAGICGRPRPDHSRGVDP